MAPGTGILSERPRYGRIASARWYTQWYWPLVLDQTEAGVAAGVYDRLLVDRNHDGDMTDEGECIQGRQEPGKPLLRFQVGDLYLDSLGEDRAFQLHGLVVQVEAGLDPAVTFTVEMDQRLFGDSSYTLIGPYGSTLKFATDMTRMPTVNLTAEIATGPEFTGKTIRLCMTDAARPFRIGEERPVQFVCLTGDPQKNEHVLAIANRSFAKPVLATLVYTDAQGATRGRGFELQDWRGEVDFAGRVAVPADAAPGAATLVVNFSEKLAGRARDDMSRHFTQLVHRAANYVDASGEQREVSGWSQPITLLR